jgi:hypothetical protein
MLSFHNARNAERKQSTLGWVLNEFSRIFCSTGDHRLQERAKIEY